MSTENSQDRVLLAAAEVFAEKGYTTATTRQIAERCGLSTGSIFHKFPNKRELLVAAVREGTIQTLDLVTRRLEGVTGAEARLRVLMAAHLESIHGASRHFMIVAARELQELTADELDRVVEIRDAYERTWQDVIDEAAAAGLVSDDPLMRLFLLGAANQTFIWFTPDAGISTRELADRFVDLVMTRRLSPTTPT